MKKKKQLNQKLRRHFHTPKNEENKILFSSII